MKLPMLKDSEERVQRQIITFGGLNYTQSAREGELRDSVGLSTERFPALSQRKGRTLTSVYAEPTALYAKGALCVVDGTYFIYGGNVVGSVLPGGKFFASIATKIIIMPDKKYYDTATGEFGSLEMYCISGAGQLTFTASTITTTGAAFGFRAGDAVEITGCTSLPENNKTVIIRDMADTVLTFYDNTFTAGAEAGSPVLARRAPDMTHICESNNRIWGVAGQTIYGSALGDPFNFYKYDGLSSDSYSVAVGTDGEFTGVMPYGSHICFFKEDCLHKLYGTKPSNYQLSTAQVPGVQAGSGKSVRNINETLYYKGRAGVYAYTGSVPELVSRNLGEDIYYDAVAGDDDGRYYISMRRGEAWGLFVYDIARGTWLKEDDTRARDFATQNGVVCFINSADNGVYAIDGGAQEGFIQWLAEFAPFNEAVIERKGYSKLLLRLELETGAYVELDTRVDGGRWRNVYKTHNERARTVYIPIIPARCDAFSIRLRGKGRCMVSSLVREYFVGSEV